MRTNEEWAEELALQVEITSRLQSEMKALREWHDYWKLRADSAERVVRAAISIQFRPGQENSPSNVEEQANMIDEIIAILTVGSKLDILNKYKIFRIAEDDVGRRTSDG